VGQELGRGEELGYFREPARAPILPRLRRSLETREWR